MRLCAALFLVSCQPAATPLDALASLRTIEIAEDAPAPARVTVFMARGRLKLALHGNREARVLLIRDSNRMVRRFVLRNPRISDEEVIAVSKNRTVDDELLRMIADGREWTKNYQVRLALVTNPKTPLVVALRFLSSLLERDIRLLAKSKNVSATIATQAKRLVAQRQVGPG